MINENTKLETHTNTGGFANAMLCDVYSSILRLFKGGENAHREWLSKPFLIAENAYATNAHFIVFFDKNFLAEDDIPQPLTGYEPDNILRLIPEEREPFVIQLSELRKAFDKSNGSEQIECDACQGGGNVHYWFYYEPEKEYYEKLHDCPICEGVGYFDNKDKVYFDFFGFRFNGNLIEKLIITAVKLKQDTVSILYSGSPMLFKVGDVRIVAAPCFKEVKDDGAVFLNIA